MKVLYGSWKEHLEKTGRMDRDPMIMPWLFSKPFRRQHPEKVLDIKARLTGGFLSGNSEALERQVKANIAHDLRGRLHQIKRHTLIMVGRYDELTPPRMAKELESEMPDAKLMIFEEGGHGLYWETPQLFNKVVLDFLNSED